MLRPPVGAPSPVRAYGFQPSFISMVLGSERAMCFCRQGIARSTDNTGASRLRMGRRLQKEMSLHVVANAAVPGPDDLCDGREVRSPLTVRKAEEGRGQVQARNVNVSRVWTRISMPVDRRRFESIQQSEDDAPLMPAVNSGLMST
ncbi:hypothetical protein VFPFJ_08576 [Purpureocillium lilacinum]|uniref:Uncharacterized protein n=1 Tax=Purpureocillium lilacinum TaxID=33203 RepID=A0A179GZS5_PURLI|nr:hypothetical protein VFPFJ_08576 [Purpureocillium lilacinum]OAQ82773.1 hypothetical protein VFPFJ_08576 [Purpureocillium lilacinum]